LGEFEGENFCPRAVPAARASARSRAEKLPFPLREKSVRAKFKKCRAIFLRGRPPQRGGWRRVSVGFAFWIYVSDLVK